MPPASLLNPPRRFDRLIDRRSITLSKGRCAADLSRSSGVATLGSLEHRQIAPSRAVMAQSLDG